MKDDFMKMMTVALIGKTESENKMDPAEVKMKLRSAFGVLQAKHTFKPGDLIQWKPGLKHEKFPLENTPAIVLEVLETPIINPTENACSPYFRQPLDLLFGTIAPDGTFLTFYGESRRYEHYVEPVAATETANS